MTSAEEFIEFATTASPRLRRTAFLLCGNWHTAEDLAQATLAKMFVSWRRVSQPEAAHAYATRTLVNCYLAGQRRKRATELLLSRPPDRAVEPQAPELRLLVLDALATLPPRARAVVVLRYWEDLSVEQVAHLLGCSPGNVKSQSARSLDKLRAVLTDAAPEHCPPGQPPAPPPGQPRPSEAQPHDARPSESRPSEARPSEARRSESRPNEARNARHG